jgi:hypothetical protein
MKSIFLFILLLIPPLSSFADNNQGSVNRASHNEIDSASVGKDNALRNLEQIKKLKGKLFESVTRETNYMTEGSKNRSGQSRADEILVLCERFKPEFDPIFPHYSPS